jgi:hypothetical protein
VKSLNRKKYYKYLFLIAAIWNWGMGIVFTLLTIFLRSTALIAFETEDPPSLVWMHGFFFLMFFYYIWGDIGFAALFPTFIDIIFAILFLECLIYIKREDI